MNVIFVSLRSAWLDCGIREPLALMHSSRLCSPLTRFCSGARDLHSFPALLGHREGKVRLRPAARQCSASASPPCGSWFLPFPGTRQESTPWHLGAAIPRVRPG